MYFVVNVLTQTKMEKTLFVHFVELLLLEVKKYMFLSINFDYEIKIDLFI